MKRFPPVSQLTPERFERQVKAWLESVAKPLEAFSAKHLDSIDGVDGEYTIDVTARFQALGGASFLIVAECKKHKNPIKREVVQALRDKQQSVGAQKAMVFATSSFQSGAIEYASKHGIALVQIVSGQAVYIQARARRELRPIPEGAEDFAGLYYGQNPDGRLIFPEILTSSSNFNLACYLGVAE
jgi:restriction system protein